MEGIICEGQETEEIRETKLDFSNLDHLSNFVAVKCRHSTAAKAPINVIDTSWDCTPPGGDVSVYFCFVKSSK